MGDACLPIARCASSSGSWRRTPRSSAVRCLLLLVVTASQSARWSACLDADAIARSADAHLVSFGGAQSNAMLAIAQLAHAKRVPFSYFSRGLNASPVGGRGRGRGGDAINSPPEGNLALALALGMRHVVLPPAEYQALAQTKDLAALVRSHDLISSSNGRERAVLVPQGAAFALAQDGLAQLAREINAYVARPEHGGRRFSVVVPCGTGTSALYMAQHLDTAATQLFAVPCVGDAAYLMQQFLVLAAHDASLSELQASARLVLPTILAPRRKARFGRLSPPLLEIHHELLSATGIEFDLNYGAFAWHTMFDAESDALALLLRGHLEADAGDAGSSRELLYVHTGGVSGNATMLTRYRAKAT